MSEARVLTIAPVRKSIRVNVSQARAFDVFTSGLDRWWPKEHFIGPSKSRRVAIEPKLGGRWYEIAQDGTETTVGHMLVWDPPHRFVMSWEINSEWEWEPEPGGGTEVEVRFTAEADNVTLVALEHRHFERLGAAGGAKIHDSVDRGWPGILELFQGEAGLLKS